MTFVQAAFLFPVAICTIPVLVLLAFAQQNIRAVRANEVSALEHLDDLRWYGWTLMMGWSPATCWQGCADLHRADWWRGYLSRTCWQGCADLHRADWWRAYLDDPEELESAGLDVCR